MNLPNLNCLELAENEQDAYLQKIQAAQHPLDPKNYCLRGMSKSMREQMKDDVFVLGQLALKGQATIFYASPNTGKTLLTLHMLIEAVRSGAIDGDNVCFINADDHHKGLIEKLEIAEVVGFHMLAPSHHDFETDILKPMLDYLIKTGKAKDSIFILDTIKKFVDYMNKKSGREFGQFVRKFISHGGTIIGLSHTNKHKDENGKSVYSGTTDIVDDFDCAYMLEMLNSDSNEKTVSFENFKSRGSVAIKQSYKYTRQDKQSYDDLLKTVTAIGNQEAERIEQLASRHQLAETHSDTINEVVACINAGIHKKTELMKEVRGRTGISLPKIAKVLKIFAGKNRSLCQFWTVHTGQNNSQIYSLNSDTKRLGAGV